MSVHRDRILVQQLAGDRSRDPGGAKNVFSASAGDRGGESSGTFWTPGGHGRLDGELWDP